MDIKANALAKRATHAFTLRNNQRLTITNVQHMIPNGIANSYPVLTERNPVDGVAIAVGASSVLHRSAPQG